MRIGIDIGNVIIGSDTDDPDQFFGDRYLQAPEVHAAFQSIAELVRVSGRHNVLIISKCGPFIQKRSLEWLSHHDFFNRTGFHRENVHFTLHRHEKAPLCDRLNIDAFIDDRFTVLEHMLPLVADNRMRQLYLFAPDEDEHTLYRKHAESSALAQRAIHRVPDWDGVQNHLLKIIEG